MPNATMRANTPTLPEPTTRRAVLAGVLAAGAAGAAVALPSAAPLAAPLSAVNEDAEVLALRAEFERLEMTRQPLVEQINELSWTFTQIAHESGYEAARVWGEQSDFLDDQLAELDSRANAIVERMSALWPRTLAGIAALAATMKEDALGSYWDKPEEDREWDVMLITRLLDGLIEVGHGPGDADRLTQDGEARS
jgi:hypothetical protein